MQLTEIMKFKPLGTKRSATCSINSKVNWQMFLQYIFTDKVIVKDDVKQLMALEITYALRK